MEDRLNSLLFSDVFLSSMTLAELYWGAEKSQQKERNEKNIELFKKPFPILPFDEHDARSFSQIRAFLERKGTPIGHYDIIIAAQAVNRNLILVTNNVKEFERIPQLQIENWV